MVTMARATHLDRVRNGNISQQIVMHTGIVYTKEYKNNHTAEKKGMTKMTNGTGGAFTAYYIPNRLY